jgi:hypothetical protein
LRDTEYCEWKRLQTKIPKPYRSIARALPVSFQCTTASSGRTKKARLPRRTPRCSVENLRSKYVRESVAQKWDPSKKMIQAQKMTGKLAGHRVTTKGKSSVRNAPPRMKAESYALLKT